ncbi:hypothetical protein [Actinokineospora sp. NBRC 105648]|uniref:hypothetical protein n=1 Tax=Actinokineospora sp. NBRC 105648 TaxID=3032206 RepID=UPI0024A425F2|nr:hypothetical protein [Actinokineospora sp. NBRC 105648]GLZ39344.1 hypothetical protein Acsp05_29680 [Actinokineospora sp. NBRC 105648]
MRRPWVGYTVPVLANVVLGVFASYPVLIYYSAARDYIRERFTGIGDPLEGDFTAALAVGGVLAAVAIFAAVNAILRHAVAERGSWYWPVTITLLLAPGLAALAWAGPFAG